MAAVNVIRDFHESILGKIETDSSGNKIVKDFHGRILGRYDNALDVTRDVYGRIVARGDTAVGLLYKDGDKQRYAKASYIARICEAYYSAVFRTNTTTGGIT